MIATVVIATINDTTNLAANLLQLVLIIGAISMVIPFAKAKRSSQAIEDLEHSLNAAEKRIISAEHTAQEAKDEATKCHIEANEWKARYEEARRYTSREAVEHFEKVMHAHSERVAERHEAMLNHLEIQTEASRSLAELVGYNTTIVAMIAEKLAVSGEIKPFIERTNPRQNPPA